MQGHKEMPEGARLQPSCFLYDWSIDGYYSSSSGFLLLANLIINLLLTIKLTKGDWQFIAILMGIIVAVVIMLVFCTKAVMGIEERKWIKTEKGGSIGAEYNVPDQYITWDEYLDMTNKPLDTELTDENCIRNKNDNSLTCF